jgi:tetratricopeptide (TPR) repeat protein
MTAEEIKDRGQRFFKAGQYSDAIPLLKSAAESYPHDESLWTKLVLAAHNCGQYEEAVLFAKRAIVYHPQSGWFWRELGDELIEIDHLAEAEKALNTARCLDNESDDLWRHFAKLYRKQNKLEKEIGALESLVMLDDATSTDLNQLGIAYYKQKHFAKALEFYRLSLEDNPSVYPLYNMGLVFNDPEISQDADAADAYRRALLLQSDYEPAKTRLESTKQKLIPLAKRALDAATGLMRSEDKFLFYISPFEALQLESIASIDEWDAKTIQRAKKRLLHEIELNDGRVSWMDDYPLDKSRAFAIVDELGDEDARRYHWAIFRNKHLLAFLTRGDIKHFLYSDDYMPRGTLEMLDSDSSFRAFLSKPFARQYNRVLSRAVERKLLPIIEILFDGRRWVEPEDDDICFEGTLQRLGKLAEQIEEIARRSTETPIAAAAVEDFLSRHSACEVLNLLPAAFRREQSRIVATIRQIAITCHNEHDDSEQSAAILKLCKKFHFKSVELNKQLEDDAAAIQNILKTKEKYKVFAGLKPINAAPSLRTTNGIGFTLYGRSDYDNATMSFVATYFFVFFGIPIFPIRRYRVSALDGGYRFFGSLPLSNANKWHFFISMASLTGLILYILASSGSDGSYTSSSASRPSAYRQQPLPSTSTSESKTVYRIPGYMQAELDKLSQQIDREKATAEHMSRQLETLDSDISRARLYLNQESQSDVDEYNSKVNAYNALLERLRAQNQLVNRLIDNYNEKLRQHGS